MANYPLYEVWGGWSDDADYRADPEHLEDCFTKEEAEEAVAEYQKNPARYAYWKAKD